MLVRQLFVTLPERPGFDELPLGRHGLLLLEALWGRPTVDHAALVDEVAERTGEPVEKVRELLDELLARGAGPASGAELPTPEPVADVVEVPDAPSAVRQGTYVMRTPFFMRCTPAGFEHFDHEGRLRTRLTGQELLAAYAFVDPRTTSEAHARHADAQGAEALVLDAEAFEDLAARLLASGLLVEHDPEDPLHKKRMHQTDAMAEAMRRQAAVNREFDRLEAEHDARGGPAGRPKVLAVHHQWWFPPSALGVIVAYCKAYQGGVLEESYDFRPRLLYDEVQLEKAAAEPCIALFSNYLWCHDINMARSALVKELNPASITIHGGPNTPKYEADVEQFFRDHPHVDVAVHGEGEETAAEALLALRGAVGDGPPDLSPLADVPGLSFRLGDRVVRTGDRDRIADLDTIPSPVLTGLFDAYIPVGDHGGISLETNRGCPYGCTFCDWGSATLARIRKFDLDRVFAELEWCARNQFGVGLADANFGIFERDVEIAEKIAELKRTYGYPREVGNNYAKNTVKHLSKIIDILTDAGIVAEGKMSMQSMDEGTLATIRRKNIKVEKYDALSDEFGRNRLPLLVELMMGLPGSTVDTLRNDLQDCIARDVRANVYGTVLLPNSPMNDPEYRAEHGIVAKPGELVQQTSTYSREDWDHMKLIRDVFTLAENFGILRQVARYVRSEVGIREIDFYEGLAVAARDEPDRWPVVSLTFDAIYNVMVPPVSWGLFLADVRAYLVDVLGIADDAALDTAITVQRAVLPARDRRFPDVLELPHDFAAWHEAVQALRVGGHRYDWADHAPRLRDFGPGTFRVDDPEGVCRLALGASADALSFYNTWELRSPVGRPVRAEAEDAGPTLN